MHRNRLALIAIPIVMCAATRALPSQVFAAFPPGALSGLSLHLQAATGSGAALSGIASVTSLLTLVFN